MLTKYIFIAKHYFFVVVHQSLFCKIKVVQVWALLVLEEVVSHRRDKLTDKSITNKKATK